MSTLRELFTPAEIQRFEQMKMSDPTFRTFADAFVREIDYIDFRRDEIAEGRKKPYSKFRAASPQALEQHYDDLEISLDEMRQNAFDKALKALETRRPTLTRTILDLQDLDRAVNDGSAEQVWNQYWQEKGIPGGIWELGLSTVTAPIRGVQKAATGDWRHPLETTAEIGSVFSVGRGVGKLVSAGLRGAGRTAASQALTRAINNRGWQAANLGVDIADIAGSRDEVYLELAGEGGFEALGLGADATRSLIEYAQNRKLDQATGAKTASDTPTPDLEAHMRELDAYLGRRQQGSPDLESQFGDLQEHLRTSEDESAAALDALASAREQSALSTAEEQIYQNTQQADRENAWRSEFERQHQQQTQIQGFEAADDAATQAQQQQQASAEQAAATQAELQEFGKQWMPFYSDQTGGGLSEAINLMTEEYQAGVRNPLEARYNQISEELRPQMGAAPAELHRETEKRLRRQIGEKWYREFRGEQTPTIEERVQRVSENAEKIAEQETTPDIDFDEFAGEYAQELADIYGKENFTDEELFGFAEKLDKGMEEAGITDRAQQDDIRQRVTQQADAINAQRQQQTQTQDDLVQRYIQRHAETDTSNIVGAAEEIKSEFYNEASELGIEQDEAVSLYAKVLGAVSQRSTQTQQESGEQPTETPETETPTEQTQTQEEPPQTYQPLADTPNMQLAAWVANKIAAEQEISRQDVVDKANEIYGGTFAEGAYEVRQAFDAVEVGGNQAILRYKNHLQAGVDNATSLIRSIVNNIEAYLPTPTRRDLEQIESQQFSTPYHYAFLANWVANISKSDIILEPSAGTGNLAWWGRRNGNEVHVNEISQRRLRMLNQSGFQNVTNYDARDLNNLMKHDNPDFAPTVVVMNPPFSADAQTGTKSEMLGADMVTEALKLLAPGGRLVAIVSGGSPAFEDSVGMAFNGSRQVQRWWDTTRSTYEVRANIKVDGKVYTKFGTEFDTRLLIIDKPMPNQTIENNPIAREVTKIDELPAMLEQIRNSRIDPTAEPTTTPSTPSTHEGGGNLQAQIASAAAERRQQRRAEREQTTPTTTTQPAETDNLQARIANAAAERRRARRSQREREDVLSDISAEQREDYEIWREIAAEQQIAYYQELDTLTEDDQAFLDALQAPTNSLTADQLDDLEIWEEIAVEQQIAYYQELDTLTEDDQAFLDALLAYQITLGGEDAGARTTTTEPTGSQPTGETTTPTGTGRTGPEDTIPTSSTPIRDGQQSGTPEQDAGGRQPVSTEPDGDTRQTDGDSLPPTQTTDADIQRPGGEIPTRQGRGAGRTEQGTVPTGDGSDVVDDRQGGTTSLDAYTPLKEKHVGDVQLVTSKNLAAVAKPSTANIEVDVPHPEQISEAQTAQVKSILRIHEQFKSSEGAEGNVDVYRKGYALAYGTGTGKTRIFSGVIIHNQQKGIKRHVVITKNWDLFKKFKKDFGVIGGDSDKVFRQDKTAASKTFPDEDGVYISTYPTLAHPGTDANRKAKIKGRLEQMLTWIVGAKPPASVLGAAELGTGMERAMELVYENELPRTIDEARSFFNDFDDVPPDIEFLLDSYSFALQQGNQRAIDRHTSDYERLVNRLEQTAQAGSRGMSATEWRALASQFDGVIVLDESHLAKNVGVDDDKDAAAQAITAQMLLRLLPNARVVYSSATTTTKLVDAGYLERLSLFGPGTPYPSFAQFHAVFDKQIGMQELGFAQLKAKGEFDAATLDMKDVEYGKIEHELTSDQIKDYNRLVEIWHVIQDAVADYIETNKAAAKRANASARFGGTWSIFWNANQRFWIDYMMSLQMNTVLNKAFELLDSGDKVVFRLVNTGEASQNRQLERSRAEGKEIADAQLTLVEPIMRYLEITFPTASMTAVRDPSSGNVRFVEQQTPVTNDDGSPVLDMDGNPQMEVVEDAEMRALRDDLLKQLNDISLPPPAIDIIIQSMRDKGFDIAEISGRKQRFVWDNNTGERVLEDNIQSRKDGDIERFLSGDLRALVFSEAGGTGQDYHALQEGSRHHLFVVQTGWNMENLEQGVGRVHRTGQTSDPGVYLAGTDIPAESRATMTALQHMRTMGAQVMGSEETGAARQMFGSGVEQYIGTDLGKDTLLGMFRKMMKSRETIAIEGLTDPDGNPYQMTIEQILDYFGMIKRNADGTGSFDEKKFKMETFLNRIMNSHIEVQRAIFDKFLTTLTEAVAASSADGTLDRGAEVLDTTTAKIVNQRTLTVDEASGAETNLVEIDAEVENPKMSWERITDRIQKSPVGEVGQFIEFLRMPRGGIVAAFRGPDQMVENRAVPRIRIVKVSGNDEFLTRDDSRIQNAERLSAEFKPETQQLWETQFNEIPDTNPEKIFVATGLVTDNWNRLSVTQAAEAQLSLADRFASTRIVRVQLDDGSTILGKYVPEGQLPFIYRDFGIEEDATGATPTTANVVTPDSLLERIMDGENLRLENNWTLALTTRDNTPIIMLRKGNGPAQDSTEMTNLGLQSITGSTGLEWFVPHGDSSVLEALLRRYPARDIELQTSQPLSPTDPDPDDEGGTGTPSTTTPSTSYTPEQRSAAEEAVNQQINDNLDSSPDALLPTTDEREAMVEAELQRMAGEDTSSQAPQTAEDALQYLQNTELTDRRENRDLLEFKIGEHAKVVANKTGDQRGFNVNVRSQNVTITIGDKEIVKNRHGKTVRLDEAVREAISNLTLSNVQEAFGEPTDNTSTNQEGEGENRIVRVAKAIRDRNPGMTIRDAISSARRTISTAGLRGSDRGFTIPTDDEANKAEQIMSQEAGERQRERDRGESRQPESQPLGGRGATLDSTTLTHLDALGIDPVNFAMWTPEQRNTQLQQIYGDLQLSEAEDSGDITDAQNEAYTALMAEINEGTLSDVTQDRPVNIVKSPYIVASDWDWAFPKSKSQRNKIREFYREIIDRIIGAVENSSIAVKLREISNQLQNGDYFELYGRVIKSAEEAALIAQFIRNPIVESTLVLFRKDGKIVRAEWFSLGIENMTKNPDAAGLELLMSMTEADDFIVIHNHPSKVARFSSEDKQSARNMRAKFGDQLAEFIVLNSGEYARMDFKEGMGGWNTNYQENVKLDLSNGNIHEPEFFGAYMRTPAGWTTLLMLDRDGRIVSALDVQGLLDLSPSDARNLIESILASTPNATNLHVVIGYGYVQSQIRDHISSIKSNDAVQSIWVDGHAAQDQYSTVSQFPNILSSPTSEGSDSGDAATDTVTRNIGGQQHSFVKVDDNTFSDVNTPSGSKKLTILGVTNELVRDMSREDVSKRTRGDAEHIVSSKRKAAVDRLDPDKLKEAREVITNAVEEAHPNKGVVNKVLALQKEKEELRAYKDALTDLSWKMLRVNTIGELRQIINASPILKTPEVDALFEGIDPNEKPWSIGVASLHEIKDAAWDKMQSVSRKLNAINNDPNLSYGNRVLLDTVEEIHQDHRIGIYRVESVLDHGGLSEPQKNRIESVLDALWGHIATEEGVYNAVLNSGKIKATHKSGSPDINEGLVAYTSYSAYYRRSEGFHNYGFILDVEKILDTIPNVTGTVHERKQWSERADLENSDEIRQAMETWHDPGDEDIVIEIRIPQDIDLNEYLTGVIENGEVYVKSEYQSEQSGDTTNKDDDLLSDYVAEVKAANPDSVMNVPLDESQMNMLGRGPGMTERAVRKAMNFLDYSSPIREKLNLWTPKARLKARQTANALHTAWRKLELLKAPHGSAQPSPGDVLLEVLFERDDVSEALRSNDLSLLRPLQKKRNDLMKKLTKESGRDKTQLRTDLEYAIVEYVEHNKPVSQDAKVKEAGITDTAELESFANDFKEAWRESNMHRAGYIIQLRKAAEAIGEKIQVELESFDGFIYDPEADGFRKMSKWNDSEQRMRPTTKDEQAKVWTNEEAHKAADRLYVPHVYTASDIQRKLRNIDALISQLNQAAKDGDISNLDSAIGIVENSDTYTFTPTGDEFTDVADVVIHAQNYWANQQASTKTYLENASGDDFVIGVYGHLERLRETDDRFYARGIDLMVNVSQQSLDRLAEMASFGHVNPMTGDSPRINDYLNQLRGWSKTPEEAAFTAVFVALRAGQPNSRYERAWDLGRQNKDADYSIIAEWRDRDTGEFTELDFERMKDRGVTDEHLAELERVGFLEKRDDGTYKVRGEDAYAQHQTIQAHFSAFARTKADREHTVNTIIKGLGHWDRHDPLDKSYRAIANAANAATTVLTLGHRTALQNLLELPHSQAMIGSKNARSAVLTFTKDKDFRSLSHKLVEAMRHTTQFMADSSFEQKYLQNPYLSSFSASDQLSRAIGAAGGIVNAEDVIERYIENPNKTNRSALRSVKINQAVIDEYVASANKKPLNEIFTEARERALSGDMPIGRFVPTGKSAPSDPMVDKIGQEVMRSAVYVSNTVLKRYDALTLPDILRSRNPFLRIFTKFMAWPIQHHSYLFRQLRTAVNEAKKDADGQRNWQPAWNLLVTSAWTAGIGASTASLYSALQGRDDDDLFETALRGVAGAHAIGMASMLLEAGLFADGNAWLLEKALTTRGAGPTIGIWARMASPVLTGDWAEAGEQGLRRIPVIRDAFSVTPIRKVFEEE